MSEPVKIFEDNSINRPLVARLKAHMLRKGLNPKRLAERAKVGRSFVYDILNGKSTNPTSGKLAAIADQLGVSVQYLLSGVHQVMGPKHKEWSDVVEISSIDVVTSTSGCSIVTSDHHSRPYYFRNEWVEKRLKARSEDLRAIFVRGDSMSPSLQEGDMLIVNITLKMPNPPGIFVLFDGVGLIVKRLEMLNKERIRAISDNPQYLPYEYDLNATNIIGKVVWLAREL